MKKSDLRFTKDHEWISLDGTIGISDYAQNELGDVVFVELPKAGKTAEKGREICVLESVKAVSSVYSPVSGTVLEVNSSLLDKPELINQEPFGKGWIAKLQIQDLSQLETLFDEDAYRKYCDGLRSKH